jgi:hypothetical protein
MTTQNQTGKLEFKDFSRGAASWLWLSVAAALLAIAGNIIALAVKSIYGGLTPAFLPQAIAQDIANLALVAPAWLVLAVLASRGSLRAYLLWLGVLTFTVYNYVIYTFAVPFGPLFLLWVAVLGLSLYALIGALAAVDPARVALYFKSRGAVVVAAWSLIVAAVLFGLLWLSEDIPALLSGQRPQSLVDMALTTNPVHILDLGFFLPGAIFTGISLLRGRPFAHVLAPALIVFMLLTGAPILLTPVIQSALGETAGWGVFAPIGTLTVLFVGLLIWLMSTVSGGD